MSFYQNISKLSPRYISRARFFKLGFNLFPPYRASAARVVYVSDDLFTVRIVLPVRLKNRNYVGSIFGGSMFAAADPIPMVQLINILDSKYVVWDKSAEIYFRAPALEDLTAEFSYTHDEVAEIQRLVAESNETEIIKTTLLVGKDTGKTYCEVRKCIYVASKEHYRAKRNRRESQ